MTLRILRRLAVGAAALMAALVPTLVNAPAAHAASFQVFTNERYTNRPHLEQYGATKATVVYDAFHYTCSASGCLSNGGPLPTQAVYEAKVKEYIGSSQFGGGATAPVVLDFEDIELTQVPTGTAATNAFNLWRQLLQWTHNAAPQAPVCNYGYDWLTQNQSLIEDLHTDPNGLDCFAPRAYFYAGQSLADWDEDFNAAIDRDEAMAPDHEIYPYVSPTAFNGGGFVSGSAWSHMFAQVKAQADGVVIWEPDATDASACAWVSQNSYEMGIVTGTSSSGPLKATVSPPSGNCTVQRGAQTAIPVTITNTSGSTTAATSMQTISGLPAGVHGYSTTWQYWNVPSLAPGASWTTMLYLQIDSTEDPSTLLFHIKTGISDTRWAAVVL
ncbi:hypothetical protein ACH429_03180 [Streptomyces pathocidini]|uniref:Uncharacterized protein n=1 Tax=Streptomyces pathocidini TaxID=1650571 RepID=A0ABW7UN24_9ACTN|nr:hypothetical protein [Streptomyces pathocidini]